MSNSFPTKAHSFHKLSSLAEALSCEILPDMRTIWLSRFIACREYAFLRSVFFVCYQEHLAAGKKKQKKKHRWLLCAQLGHRVARKYCKHTYGRVCVCVTCTGCAMCVCEPFALRSRRTAARSSAPYDNTDLCIDTNTTRAASEHRCESAIVNFNCLFNRTYAQAFQYGSTHTHKHTHARASRTRGSPTVS